MKWIRLIFLLVFILAVGVLGYWFGKHQNAGAPETQATKSSSAPNAPVARVDVAPVKETIIAEKINVFGTISVAPSRRQIISVPYECKVLRVLTVSGEGVFPGQILLEIGPSPSVQLQFAQAQITAQTAAQELKQTQQRYELKLATQQELGRAQQAADAAALNLQTLKEQAPGATNAIRSDLAGFATKVDVGEGQIVAPGAALIEFSPTAHMEARLGVDPSLASALFTNEPVRIFAVYSPQSSEVEGRIRFLARNVDPLTRLLGLFVSIESSGGFLVGDYVRGEIAGIGHKALVVPRTAVLKQGGREILFTVTDHRAVEHFVQTGIETDREVELIGGDLHPGELVVVRGNYELGDGMAVTTEENR